MKSALLVDDEVNANVTTNIGKFHVEHTPADDDDRYFEDATGLDKVERNGVG